MAKTFAERMRIYLDAPRHHGAAEAEETPPYPDPTQEQPLCNWLTSTDRSCRRHAQWGYTRCAAHRQSAPDDAPGYPRTDDW